MKIALFTTFTTSYEVRALARTANEKGYELVLFPLHAMMFEFTRSGKLTMRVTKYAEEFQKKADNENVGIKVATPDTKIEDFDIALQRGTVYKGGPSLRRHTLMILDYCAQLGIPYLNSRAQPYPKGSKIWQYHHLAKKQVPIVPTRFSGSLEALPEVVKDLEFPLFVKEHVGQKGKNAYLVNNLAELKKVYQDAVEPAALLLQKYLRTREDLRIIVIGGKVLGGMKRVATGDSHVSNFSQGGKVVKADLQPDEIKLAEKVANVLFADYAGVDLMRDQDGELYTLECNDNAQFKGFEQATGLDVPARIFDFLYSQRK